MSLKPSKTVQIQPIDTTNTISMQSKPLISVLMPAFNAALHIQAAIESILAQTYSNFELIILNDGSTDETKTIVLKFKDPRIIFLEHEQNQGLIASRNRLVKQAQGKYIALMDADDIADSHRLATQLDFLENETIDICASDHLTLYESTGKIKRPKQRHSDPDIRALMTVACPISNPTVMVKASILKQNPYEDTVEVAEDYALWCTLALQGYRFANIAQNLLTYRVHSTSISQSSQTRTQQIITKLQERYIKGLNMNPVMRPYPRPWLRRIGSAPQFMVDLNRAIPGISVMANYQIYARFQYRGNGIWTPLTRLERLAVAMLASFIGRL